MQGAASVRAPLVGRDVELGRIATRLDEPTAAAFVLAGEAGVGKTRLASEVASVAVGRGFVTAEVVASRSAGSIPFGSFAPLLPVGHHASDLFGLLLQSSAAILERAGPDGRLLLVVDDAHLLDDGSAALVHQLVRTRACSFLGTVRTLEPAPDPVTALWKDGLAERLELDPLSESEVAEIVAGVLDGPVARASVRRLWDVSQGNALYLRELLAGALDGGALIQAGGIWSLAAPLTAPVRLVELIESRLEGAPPETIAAIEFVAAAEPLGLAILERLCSPAAIDDAEHRGLIRLIPDGRRMKVRLVHPLYVETLRQTLPVFRRRQVFAALAAAVSATGARRREDLLRLAHWELESGRPDSDPELLTRAARQAMERFDVDLAAQLAERALECGGDAAAGLVLGEARFRSGRTEEAEIVLASAAARSRNDAERARLANARAYNLHTLIGDTEAAESALDEALAVIQDESARLSLLGRRATNRLIEGRPSDALAAAAPLLAADDDRLVARGTFVSSVALALLGRGDEAVVIAAQGLEVHRRIHESTQLPEAQHVGAILGHLSLGELGEAVTLADVSYHACLAAGDREGQATKSMLGAFALVERGQLAAAARGFREGAAINRDLNDDTALRWCLGGVVLAEALSGAREPAFAAAAELDGLPSKGMHIYEFDVIDRGRAWAHVAAGEQSKALELLVEAAARAAENDQWVAEARLRHDLARLGDAGGAAARLAELAAMVRGQLVTASARHADGLARESPSELDAAGAAFEELGAHIYAAEAFLAAARLFRAEGLARRAAEASRRAEAQRALCREARTPGVLAGERMPILTRREREVAGLATAGDSSREIAEKLVLSVRTVENHLQNAYGKLGVTSRSGLAEALRES